MNPPPTTTSDSGNRSSAIAVVLVSAGTSSMPGMGGDAGDAPVAITILPGRSSAPFTRTPSPVGRARPSM